MQQSTFSSKTNVCEGQTIRIIEEEPESPGILKEHAEQLKTQIANMKQYLSSIVQGYGYKNVKEFLTEYRASKAEYSDYQSAVVKWEQQTGNKAESDSLKAKLQRKQQEAKELNRHNKHQKKYSRDVR